MLTENQKKLLSDLQSEFEGFNITKNPSSSLIEELRNEIHSEREARKEIDAYNSKFLISLYDKLNKDIKDFIRFFDDNRIAFKSVTLNSDVEDLIERVSQHSLPNLISIQFSVEHYTMGVYTISFKLKYTEIKVGELSLYKIEGLNYYTNLIEDTNECGAFRGYLKKILLSY